MRLGMFQIGKKLHDDNLVINPRFKQKLYAQIFNEGTTTTMAKKHMQLDFKQLIKQRKVLYSGGLVLALLATTVWYGLDNRQQSLARQSEIEKVVELPKNLDGVLSAEQMQTLATTDAPSGTTVTGVEIENEHGTVLYKVKFSDGTYRLYDAKTGLAYIESSDSVETDQTVPVDFVSGITLQKARDIAAAQRPGKTITKIELETENGVVVYSVRFSDDGRVDVNAKDGSVVRVRSGSNSTTPSTGSGSSSNNDSDDSIDSEDHAEEDTEDDGDRSGSNKDEEDNDNEDNSGSDHEDSDDDN